jgi:hypothetical protein
VIGILYGQLSSEQYAQFFTLGERKDQVLDLLESLRIVCTAALIDPKIVDEPLADNEITIDDLEDTEQRYIFDLALLEATALSRFREQQEQEADVDVMDPDTGVALQTESTAGN